MRVPSAVLDFETKVPSCAWEKPGSEQLKPLCQTDRFAGVVIRHVIVIVFNIIMYKSLYNQTQKGDQICPAT